jgi:glutaredoxin 3
MTAKLEVKAKVVIYTKSHCPYCVRAKELLTRKGAKFEEIYLDDHPEEYDALKKRTGHMTVPQIFINDQMIGGFSDMSALDQKNELDPLLAAAP